MAAAQLLEEGPGPGSEVVLRDDIRGSAELAGQFERVAATDLEVPALVDARAERIHVRKLRGCDAHCRSIMP